jgi:hypothetical protein
MSCEEESENRRHLEVGLRSSTILSLGCESSLNHFTPRK